MQVSYTNSSLSRSRRFTLLWHCWRIYVRYRILIHPAVRTNPLLFLLLDAKPSRSAPSRDIFDREAGHGQGPLARRDHIDIITVGQNCVVPRMSKYQSKLINLICSSVVFGLMIMSIDIHYHFFLFIWRVSWHCGSHEC